MPTASRRRRRVVLPGVRAPSARACRTCASRGLVEPVLRGGRARARRSSASASACSCCSRRARSRPACAGLGILRAAAWCASRATRELKVPHMGWNQLRIVRSASRRSPSVDGRRRTCTSCTPTTPLPADPDVIATTTSYGVDFVSQRRRATTSSPASSTPRRASASASACCAGFVRRRVPDVIVYPAIDLRGGRCVRLTQGDFARETVYGDDPVGDGAALGGARARAGCTSSTSTARAPARPCRPPLVARHLRARSRSPCRWAAGCATRRRVATVLDAGAARVVLGHHRGARARLAAQRLCRRVPGPRRDRHRRARRHGAGRGLARGRSTTPRRCSRATAAELRARRRSSTPTSGATARRQGPNLEATRAVARAAGIPVIASGGVGDARARARGRARWPTTASTGVIVGRALYTGAVDLRDALAARLGRAR